ncbi:hypothetical protein E2C01_100215 [Portunus trituberculatus]|uniref:Uncharacterized protein n=1 Tax=Portunus trituberculatus TaxID=210409 RepID=A0A5B7K670_PORTR|nr:hypothetical protein [Portunus trituberculatus]
MHSPPSLPLGVLVSRCPSPVLKPAAPTHNFGTQTRVRIFTVNVVMEERRENELRGIWTRGRNRSAEEGAQQRATQEPD